MFADIRCFLGCRLTEQSSYGPYLATRTAATRSRAHSRPGAVASLSPPDATCSRSPSSGLVGTALFLATLAVAL